MMLLSIKFVIQKYVVRPQSASAEAVPPRRAHGTLRLAESVIVGNILFQSILLPIRR